MRKAVIRGLVELAEKDPRVVFLTADLGYTVVEPFAERFPDRFFNVGVSEQNMIGVASGLAESGFIPYVYSIAPFAALRPYEFIRNGPVLQRLPVRIIGVGGGFDYAPAGPTHYALEDIGVFRMLPGMHVIAPADARQCRTALLALHDSPEPAYFRLGKDEKYEVPGLDGRFAPGRAQTVRHGADCLFICLGPIVAMALRAADTLAQSGLQSTVVAVASMSPAPADDLAAVMARFRSVLTVEAHYVSGGLGSLVCETVAERSLDCRVTRCGVTASPAGEQGDAEYMARRHGLSPERLVGLALKDRAERVPGSLSPATGSSDWRTGGATEPARGVGGAIPGKP